MPAQVRRHVEVHADMLCAAPGGGGAGLAQPLEDRADRHQAVVSRKEVVVEPRLELGLGLGSSSPGMHRVAGWARGVAG